MAPFNKTRKFGKPSFGQGPKKFGSGPRKFGAGPRPAGGPKRFGGGGNFRRAEGGDFERPRFDKPRFEKQLFRATCASCGKPCEVPFKPTGERPVFCRDCFQQQGADQPQAWHQRIRTSDYSGERKPSDFRNERLAPRPAEPQLAQELAAISVKLDRILRALEKLQAQQTAPPAVEGPSADAKPKAPRRPRRKAAAAEDAESEAGPRPDAADAGEDAGEE